MSTHSIIAISAAQSGALVIPVSRVLGTGRLRTAVVRLAATSLIAGPIVLVGALPAAAGPLTQVAANSDSSADRGSFTQAAQDDLHQWQQRVHDFDVSAEATGKADTIATEHALNAAWDRVQVEAGKLQTASRDEWESAKISYQKASHDLTDEWDRTQSQHK
jgi:hypothetical protein